MLTPILILARHGESEGNARDIFTGSLDLPLTGRGRSQAAALAGQLRRADALPGVVFTSTLGRSRESAQIITGVLGSHCPVIADAALDERDYGALTGCSKAGPIAGMNPREVDAWRRSAHERPPQGESLTDVMERVLAFYQSAVRPELSSGLTALVVGHGNNLRALLLGLGILTVSDVEGFNIDPGEMIAFETRDGLIGELRRDITTIDPLRRFNL